MTNLRDLVGPTAIYTSSPLAQTSSTASFTPPSSLLNIPESSKNIMNFFKSAPLRLLAWIQGVWQGQDKKQSSGILNLPVDLVHCIADHLPVLDQVVLAQTCHDLRAVFYRPRYSPRHLSRREFLKYLAILARDMPDQWVCEVCNALHPVITSDAPRLPERSSCHMESIHVDYNLALFNLKHRHVQLTLKYTRMAQLQRRYRDYLKLLLSTTQSTFLTHQFVENPLTTLLITRPKVVKGKYLLLSILEYRKKTKLVSPSTIGSLRVCKHQDIAFPSAQALRVFIRYGPQLLNLGLMDAVNKAFEADHRGTEIRGYCPGCPTDFTVRITPEHATIKIWQDLGSEGSPLQPNWRVHTYEYYSFRPRPVEFFTYDKPGTIRSLYEKNR
ncbi:hypothetical protein AK830_g10646 [Neonectria ditissima]|uniref:F-box domain-containing protein n=1 Tax=Neonectria ditissima TaxID=78410 RepID=A0A0P7B611_9HYPO|nr:hypothetical protein AK830_g10646 [Neonectria ditissima]